MNKKIFLLLFIFLISISNTDAIDINRRQVVNKKYLLKSIDNEKLNIKQKINFNDKKVLKKEIQKRKKYHKNLVSLYNNWFYTRYLNIITKNSIIIYNLRKYYELNFTT